MSHSFTLFEVSFEVCNKIGGIYTVLSTRAQTLVERFGDDYLTIGPWLPSDTERRIPFDEEPLDERLRAACEKLGLVLRQGRWRIPGAPRALLVDFSSLYDDKDAHFARLWEDFQVDSITGDWDYVEPVLFSLAAAQVIEAWCELSGTDRPVVAQFHEWMCGAGLLHLKRRCPNIGTVFTTHATMLGRALSSTGRSPEDGLGGQTPEQLAEESGVVAKHSLESITAREADVFTTVSQITARESELLLGRAPDPLLPNGIDLEVVGGLAGDQDRGAARERLATLASRFLGEDVSDSAFLCVSGRYEFKNKGIDVLLDALARLKDEPGRRIVLFVLVPAGHKGLNPTLAQREHDPEAGGPGPLGLSTHEPESFEHDPVHERCGQLGLDNALGSRIRIVQIPVYLDGADGFVDLPTRPPCAPWTCRPSLPITSRGATPPRRAWRWACRRSPRTTPASAAGRGRRASDRRTACGCSSACSVTSPRSWPSWPSRSARSSPRRTRPNGWPTRVAPPPRGPPGRSSSTTTSAPGAPRFIAPTSGRRSPCPYPRPSRPSVAWLPTTSGAGGPGPRSSSSSSRPDSGARPVIRPCACSTACLPRRSNASRRTPTTSPDSTAWSRPWTPTWPRSLPSGPCPRASPV